MTKFKRIKSLTAPALLLGTFALVAPGCSAAKDAASAGECAAGLKAKAEAFQASVKALTDVSAQMKADLAVACTAIAKDLGGTPKDLGDGKAATDDEMKANCDAASAAITASITANGSIAVSIEGGKCEVAASAQFDCEATCDVSGTCAPPSVEARCDPGQISGSCSGTCSAGATCEGSATVEAACNGTCEATCKGKCDAQFSGKCDGNCDGKCDGTSQTGAACTGTCEGTCTGTAVEGKCSGNCDGTCSGNCTLKAGGDINCGATATCKGTCSVAVTAPKCEAELKPAECNLDADCQAGCTGQGSLKATCTEPKVVVTTSASANGALVTTLTANLPKILKVVSQAELAAKAAVDIAAKAGGVAAEVAASVGCVAQFGASFAADLQASVKASASVKVSVSASASTSGSASGG